MKQTRQTQRMLDRRQRKGQVREKPQPLSPEQERKAELNMSIWQVLAGVAMMEQEMQKQ